MPDSYAIDADWNALYVDGEWTAADSDETIAVEDPSTREQVATVPAAVEADVDPAYEAAAEAQSEWADAPPARRAEVIQDAIEALQAHSEEITDLLAHEAGGSAIMGETSVQIATDQAGEAATLPRRMKGEHAAANIPGKEHVVKREPRGVVTVISPWNFPLNLSMRAVAPALATGNAVVVKPATNTPITGGLLFAKLFEEAGLPDGLLNVVTGRGSDIGDRVAGHPESDMVAFTGSTEVGRHVAATAGENLAEQSMELGGNNAHVVTADADIDRAIDSATFGSFVHQGQVCISINRHLVHESIYDEYVERLAERAEGLTVGDPREEDTVVGPIINEEQRDQIMGFIEDTLDEGGELEAGGDHDGLFVEPTVISNVTNDMSAACNEHFGPVAPVIPFADDDEAVELANATEYGLAGSVHSADQGRARDVADQIEVGMMHVNDQPVNAEPHPPFGGMKDSGVGRYNGDWIIEEFTVDKWTSIQREDREYLF